MKQLIIIILLSIQTQLVPAQIQYAIDSTEMMIGDQVTLSISGASHHPTLDQLSQGDIEVVRQWIDSTEHGSDGYTYKYLLTCFEEGEHWIHLSPTDSIMLKVNDVANVDTTDVTIRDIAEIVKEPVTFKEVLPWIVIGLLAAGLIYVLISIVRKKPIITVPQPKAIPPHETALTELARLKERQLWQNGMAKPYHTELTDIVRMYIERVCDIRVTDMTSDQTIEAMQERFPQNTAVKENIYRILTTADLVKFAKSEPLPHEHELSMSQAVALVNTINEELEKETRQKEEQQHE